MNAKTGGIVMLVIGVILLVFSLTTPSFGEIVTIESGFFADRSTVHGYLFAYGKEDGGKIALKMRWNSVPDEYRYGCSDKWDWKKVNNATNKISEYINKNKNIDVKEMLKKAGLSDCKFVDANN